MKRFLSKGIFKDQISGLDSLEWIGIASVIAMIVIFILIFFF